MQRRAHQLPLSFSRSWSHCHLQKLDGEATGTAGGVGDKGRNYSALFLSNVKFCFVSSSSSRVVSCVALF